MASNKWRRNLPPIPKETLPKEKQEQLLERIATGLGINRTFKDLKITQAIVRNTIAADPEFAERYRVAREEPKEMLEEIVFARALDDPEFAMGVLGRMDRIKIANQKRLEDRATRKLAAAALGGPADENVRKIDLKRLTREQLIQFKNLLEIARGGDEDDVDDDGQPGQPD